MCTHNQSRYPSNQNSQKIRRSKYSGKLQTNACRIVKTAKNNYKTNILSNYQINGQICC